MVVESRNKNVPIFVLVVVSHTYAVNQSLCRQGWRMLALKKWNVGGGGDSRVMRLLSQAVVGSLRRVLCNVKCYRCRRSIFKHLALFFLSGPRKNLIFCSSPPPLWSRFFTAKVIDWSKNYF